MERDAINLYDLAISFLYVAFFQVLRPR